MPSKFEESGGALQPDVQPAAPSAERRAAGHDAAGRFTAGNQDARRSGVRAFETRGAAALPAELRDAQAAFYSALEADQGGAGELTTIGAGYVRRLTELETICRLLGADLQARGLFTPRGRVRSTYGAFLQTIDRWDKLAQRLGLSRKARQVPTLAEVMNRDE
jgi:hypothetical protein